MKWKFWQRDKAGADETTIKVTKARGPGSATTEIYVCAQTSDKTLKLYRKLAKEEKQ